MDSTLGDNTDHDFRTFEVDRMVVKYKNLISQKNK